MAVEAKKADKGRCQQTLQCANVDAGKLLEYAVLVTDSDFERTGIGQLYQDRADCQNDFDDLKNQ